MYGSSFWTPTLSPWAFSSVPSEAAVMPLPRDETTPPVMNTYLVFPSTAALPVSTPVPLRDGTRDSGDDRVRGGISLRKLLRTGRICSRAAVVHGHELVQRGDLDRAREDPGRGRHDQLEPLAPAGALLEPPQEQADHRRVHEAA